ncbi:MAG: ATP-binding cassette domain-containing protein [Planctomycetes bacterium]|nr:ATP-binding cassette domain-containing protein [Planctomycetota bacterium]
MAAPLLEARDLLVRPPGAPAPVAAVDELVVDPGRVLALVGESGAGKSSLARALVAFEALDRGRVRFAGELIASADRRERPRAGFLRRLRRRFQIVFQDPDASLDPRMTLGESVAEGALGHGLWTRRDAPERAAGELARLGLDPTLAARFPAEVSGGQRRRAALARVLALEPELLVLDEISAGIEAERAVAILDLVLGWARAAGSALILVSHDIGLLEGRVDELLVMRAGRVLERGPAERLFGAPEQAYTRSLLSAARGERAWIEGP